jgi:hypothetical protein
VYRRAGCDVLFPTSIEVPAVRKHLNTLGTRLGWHGALSADAILTANGPVYIDINPRLVEPGNAWEAGVDLVGTLLDIARGTAPTVQPSGRPDIATHQLLIAVLAAAELRGRRGVLGEIAAAWRHADGYTDSTEELTPVRGDWRSAIPLATASAAVLARPSAWRWFASSAVANYSLTSAGWSAILNHRL